MWYGSPSYVTLHQESTTTHAIQHCIGNQDAHHNHTMTIKNPVPHHHNRGLCRDLGLCPPPQPYFPGFVSKGSSWHLPGFAGICSIHVNGIHVATCPPTPTPFSAYLHPPPAHNWNSKDTQHATPASYQSNLGFHRRRCRCQFHYTHTDQDQS